MNSKTTFQLLLILILTFQIVGCKNYSDSQQGEIIQNKWQSLKTIDEDGLVGERVDLWRNNRLWNIAESGYLIDGFEHRPGKHPWQGEHLGKWLHAATLAYQISGEKALKNELDEMVERLLATQLPDGYMGTYAEEARFMNVTGAMDPELLADDIQEDEKEAAAAVWKNAKGGWDTWTFRYNLYGLLTYESYFPNEKVVDACKKMADLLIDTYGEGKADLTDYGTRKGISATTLLESIVMLYERTSEKKYLDFAEGIVAMSENNSSLRLMGTMLENGSVVYPGEGIGYQLMANLLGYLRLYRCTGKEKYLKTVNYAWGNIYKNHLLVTGGPWTRKMPYNANGECFAFVDAFHPEKLKVEGCCDATWIQLNSHLFELTGDAKYFNEAEITLFNSVYGHQHMDGIQWCYYTAPNEESPKYRSDFHCCGSSEPRGLEMYSSHLAGYVDNSLSINSLASSVVELTDQFGGGVMKIESNFPLTPSAEITIETQKKKNFTLEIRLPANSSPARVTINGELIHPEQNSRGFVELNRKWKNGDMIGIDLTYELKAHIQEGEEGRRWVAFTYGPLALAQKIAEMPDEEPFYGVDREEFSDMVNSLSKTLESDIEFTIQGTNITLIPYLQTVSANSGPRTYFEL
jgi:DUF1680 family protein